MTENGIPELTVPSEIHATVGMNLTFMVNASDPDGDSVTIEVVTEASDYSFDNSTGILKWTPEDMTPVSFRLYKIYNK